MRSIRRAAVNAVILAVAFKTSSGCAANVPRVVPRPQSAVVEDRIAAIRRAVARDDHSSVPHLVDRLDDEDVAVRFAAILALEKLTGRRFGFHYGASAEDRALATARWRRFLRKNRASAMPMNAENRMERVAPPSTDAGSES